MPFHKTVWQQRDQRSYNKTGFKKSKILIQCSNIAIRHDDYLRSFYQRIKRRRGHKIAIVATARKMLVCIYYMLKRKEAYDP